ncbi:MAG: hypothetical protein AB1650_06120 [Candidatus Omnitrophota bacterium]
MSRINDQLKSVEECKSNMISQALDKKQREFENSQASKGISGRSSIGSLLPLFIIGIFVVGGASTIFYAVDRMMLVNKKQQEVVTLLEDHLEEYVKLEEHVKAVELEFRGAFKKDREQMKAMLDATARLEAGAKEAFEKSVGEMRTEFFTFKNSFIENEADAARISREYSELMTRFDQVKEEMRELRSRVMALTATETLQ